MSSIPTNTGKIFNVEEVTGKEHAAFETTAAEAQINAPNRVEAMHVSENAERAKEAANQAASVAKTLGSDYTGEPTTAAGQFKAVVLKTDAVSEGGHGVGQAKAVGAGYIEQAKELSSQAIETAQNYLPTALGGKPADTTHQQDPSFVDQVRDTAVNLYTRAVTTQPRIDSLRETSVAVAGAAQPHVENAKGTTTDAAQSAVRSASQPHIGNARGKFQGWVWERMQWRGRLWLARR